MAMLCRNIVIVPKVDHGVAGSAARRGSRSPKHLLQVYMDAWLAHRACHRHSGRRLGKRMQDIDVLFGRWSCPGRLRGVLRCPIAMQAQKILF
jgi:hypothetical protein